MANSETWIGVLPDRPGAERLRAFRKLLTLSVKHTETAHRSGGKGKKRKAQELRAFCDLAWPGTTEPLELRNKGRLK